VDVFSCKEMCLAQQDKVIGVLLCLFKHYQLCVYGSVMQGVAWQERLSCNIKEGSSLAATWKHWNYG